MLIGIALVIIQRLKCCQPKNVPPSFSFPMFPAHHGASGFGSYRQHRISGAQTKGVYLIYDLLVMPPALDLVKFFGGGKW
jgi:hypothetical protein